MLKGKDLEMKGKVLKMKIFKLWDPITITVCFWTDGTVNLV